MSIKNWITLVRDAIVGALRRMRDAEKIRQAKASESAAHRQYSLQKQRVRELEKENHDLAAKLIEMEWRCDESEAQRKSLQHTLENRLTQIVEALGGEEKPNGNPRLPTWQRLLSERNKYADEVRHIGVRLGRLTDDLRRMTKQRDDLRDTLANIKSAVGGDLHMDELVHEIAGAFSHPSAKGVDIISRERARQIEQEGWSLAHDAAQNDAGELLLAASCYAEVGYLTGAGFSDAEICKERPPEEWPFDAEWWKPDTTERMLAKAGALIAAELDRIT